MHLRVYEVKPVHRPLVTLTVHCRVHAATAQDASRLDTTHSCPPGLAGCLIMQPYDATLTYQGLQSPAS